jgi:hypothetical protein
VCYPIRILVEDVIVEILHLEFVIGVDNGLHPVVVLHHIKPCLYTLAEILDTLVLGLMLHIKHRRQVTVFQFDIFDEELCLCLGAGARAIEMIGTTRKSILTGIVEIIAEVLINLVGALRSLNHNEAYGTAVDKPLFTELRPVYIALVMTDVYAVNLVALRITHVAIKSTPSEAKRTYEDEIEEIDIEHEDG